MENTQNVDGVGMVLKRIEIEEKIYRPILNDKGSVDREMMERIKTPWRVIDFYISLPKDRLKEYSNEMGLWCRQGIDDAVNEYLKEHKITKARLHSIETKVASMIGMSQRAIIIYEEKEE